MKSGIYQIRNTVNGKVYVGQAEDIPARWREHRYDLRMGLHSNSHLQAAYNKYGKAAFEWSVLELCPIEGLDEREVWWISETGAYENGYNMTSGGGGIRGFFDVHGTRVICIESGQEYDSIATAARKTGVDRTSIGRCCVFSAKTAGGLHWRYSDMPYEAWQTLYSGRFECPDPRALPVVCLDTGIVYDSVISAARAAGVSKTALVNACKGKTHKAAGLRWKYQRTTDEEYEAMQTALHENAKAWEIRRAERLKTNEMCEFASTRSKSMWQNPETREKLRAAHGRAIQARRKRVVQVETGTIFDSIIEATRSVGAPRSSHIVSCCTGQREKAYGYHWKYAD